MELFLGTTKRDKFPRVSTIVVDHTSSSFNNSTSPIIPQGNQRGGKPNNLLKSSSSSLSGLSSSSSVGRIEENLCVSSRLPVGTTMKKLLADEMKERDSGRRSPSVIANLMGLDWLPAQHNAGKQQKRVSDNYQKKSNSAGLGRSGKGNDSGSHRKHGKGQQKCKDVYEVTERSNTETGSTTSRAASFRNISDEDEVAFVRQKFIDVKRFSTDERLRHSKEFHDALEVLDSNKDLLLKFLQEPNSLFTKHLHHLHGAREAHCACVEGVKSSNTLKCNVDVIGHHSSGEASRKIDISHSCKHRDRCQHKLFHRHNVDSQKLHFSAEGEEDSTSIATRIVVLKPNMGKARNTARSFSSSTPSCDLASDSELQNGYSNVMQLRPEMMGKRTKRDDSDLCDTRSRESRELAREVTRRMKCRLGVDSFNVSSSAYKGYSADESSGDISENDSSYESDVTILGSATSLNRGIYNRASTSPHLESSINREAKKRLSRRWKMTHRSQETGASGKGSTLAEMLAIPDVDVRSRNPDFTVARDESLCRSHGRDEGTTESTPPSGISSRDGWRDGGVRNPSRYTSPSASSSHLGSPKSSSRYEAITADRFLVRARSSDNGKKQHFKRDSERNVGSFPGSTRSKVRECQSTCVEIIDDIQEVPSSVNMVTNSTDGKFSPDVKSVITDKASCELVPRVATVDSKHKSVSKSLNYPDELVPATRTPSSVLPHDRIECGMLSVPQEPASNFGFQNSSCLQIAATQPESPPSSKDSEQPSPVSVLEAPFVEEVSSGSECFEKVSAELNGLRMQLQLLKQESEGYDEGSILISSDECEEESTELEDGKGLHFVGEGWESSYLLDVLTYSGYDEIDRDMFLETWHSPDCPIGPWVFDNLETKYGGWKSCLRSERKLLFDRINAGITQIVSQYLDMDPLLNPFLRNVSPQRWKDGLKSELRSFLKNHEKASIENVMDAAILGGMQWFKLGDHLGTIGRDIERILIDDLVEEIISF